MIYVQIAVEDIGRIEKVRLTDGRIGQDGNQTWSVSSLTMSDIDTGEEMIYNFKDMVGKNSQNARNELPALRAGELIQPGMEIRNWGGAQFVKHGLTTSHWVQLSGSK